MFDNLNKWLQKLLPILTPLSLVIGVIFQNIGVHLLFLVSWLFAFMTFSSSLSMNVKDVKSFSKHSAIILGSIAFLHIIMPIWAYFLSTIIFDDHLLTIGFVISVAVPTGVTSVIWVSICRGNLPLCLSIILIDTLLSPLLMPALLHIAVGESIAIDTSSLILDLLWMIVLPTVVGVLLNELTKGNIQMTLGTKLAPFSKLCLFGVVMINSSAIAPYLKQITWELVSVIFLVLFIAASGYAIALILGHIIWKDTRIVTTFVFIGGMRNIAIGVIVATTYFPAKVAMPVVFGMLFQQVLASLYSKVVEKYKMKFEAPSI
ncbi:bile acid:sodium symporter family protein [Lederbergia wuyishanensis]|uniref:Na+-dependent transporter n=1 Tax=Lederbergia wuyishanensis TaxID=1347903 RepID=A0ABU0D663_9BACI|nr:bile acid:sodium symporter [Lederbergia wuyishanensis]MCJ8008722.1 bile acid:sodium symporter family protein [Lederbergia wuyishanensis]MDQ0343858.1 putative Na+-dependent transporter [Lederbergia wuyishanensis]